MLRSSQLKLAGANQSFLYRYASWCKVKNSDCITNHPLQSLKLNVLSMGLEFQKFVSLQSRMATLQNDWHTDVLLFLFIDQTTACLSYSCSSADFPNGRYLERQWMCILLNLKCLPPSMWPMPVMVPWSNGLVFQNMSLLREIMQLHYLYRSLPLGWGEKRKQLLDIICIFEFVQKFI